MSVGRLLAPRGDFCRPLCQFSTPAGRLPDSYRQAGRVRLLVYPGFFWVKPSGTEELPKRPDFLQAPVKAGGSLFFGSSRSGSPGNKGRAAVRVGGVTRGIRAGCDSMQKPCSHDTSRIARANQMARVAEELLLECRSGGGSGLIPPMPQPGPIQKILPKIDYPFACWKMFSLAAPRGQTVSCGGS